MTENSSNQNSNNAVSALSDLKQHPAGLLSQPPTSKLTGSESEVVTSGIVGTAIQVADNRLKVVQNVS